MDICAVKVRISLDRKLAEKFGCDREAVRMLRDRIARAGWPTKRIDRMLKRLNGRSTPAVQRAVLREWEGELGEGSGE